MLALKSGYENANALFKLSGIQSVKNLLTEKQYYADRYGWSSDESYEYWSGYREFIDDHEYKVRICNSIVSL